RNDPLTLLCIQAEGIEVHMTFKNSAKVVRPLLPLKHFGCQEMTQDRVNSHLVVSFILGVPRRRHRLGEPGCLVLRDDYCQASSPPMPADDEFPPESSGRIGNLP